MMDYQDIKLCDRCQCQQYLLTCSSCAPYHNFCSKCDTDVHSLPSKTKHQRIPITYRKAQLHQSNDQSHSDSFQKPQTVYQQPSTLTENPLFYYPSSNISFLESKQADHRSSFTKEYVNELKAIHQKEKTELLFKISSLQSTLDRLKASFGDHINKMQVSVDENNKLNNTKMKQFEEERDFTIKKTLLDKDNLIEQLKKDNTELLKANDTFYQSLTQNENQLDHLKEQHDNQVASLSNELNNKKEEIEVLKIKTEKQVDEIQQETKNKIAELTVVHEHKMSDIAIDNELKMDELSNQYKHQICTLTSNLEHSSREMYLLKEKMEVEHKEHQQCVCVLQEENDKLRTELQYFQEQNSSLFHRLKQTENDLMGAQSENEIALHTIERQKSDLIRKNEEVMFCENGLKALKNENCLLTDKNAKLQNDYTRLCSQSDTVNYEYENKIRSLNYVEDKNFALERENNELRNRMGRIVRPYTFNTNN